MADDWTEVDDLDSADSVAADSADDWTDDWTEVWDNLRLADSTDS